MDASSDDKGDNDEDIPKTPYDDGNMNSYYNNKENNDEVAPKLPSNDEIINANYDEITPDTPTNGINNETIDNDEEKIF